MGAARGQLASRRPPLDNPLQTLSLGVRQAWPQADADPAHRHAIVVVALRGEMRPEAETGVLQDGLRDVRLQSLDCRRGRHEA